MDLEKPISDLNLILRACTESAWVPPRWAVETMAAGLSHWHREEIPEPTQRSWMRMWELKAREVGSKAVQEAMLAAMQDPECRFIPSPNDLFGYLPEPEEKNASTYVPPTADQEAFRGTEEQREEWRKIKAKIDEIGKMPSRTKDTRNYTPTLSELAEELAANPLVRVGRKETA